MSDASLLAALATLPPLWATEACETAELILPMRFTCRWHALSWYPVERDGDVLFGFPTRIVPERRHVHLRQLLDRHHGDAVVRDANHRPAAAPDVPEIWAHRLDDITPFRPSRVPLP